MAGRSIYWHDGMFMWPHHMQLEERCRAHELALHNRWNVHYHWGLRSLDVDLEALKDHRLVVRGLRARMRDGTLISAPEDCPLPALDVKEALEARDPLIIYLALPVFKENQANVPEAQGASAHRPETPAHDTRFVIASVDTEDENTGGDVQALQVRGFNARLLMDTQDLAGYELLPILRIGKSRGTDAQVQLDSTYIPPLLACDAWQPLAQQIMQDLYHRFGSRMESLANQIVSRAITFDTRNPGDHVLLGQLSVLNEAYTTLNTLAFSEGVHPLQAYVELCRIVGQLAIYNPARRVPDLPRYDHDDLGFCFHRVLHQLESIELTKAEYVERVFIGEDLRMQVALERSWLEPAWQMFVGVQSTLKAEEVIRLLTKSGHLDMKIGSADRVDFIFERGLQGLEFKPADRVPRDLPATTGLVYFQVNRESRKEEWLNIQKSLTLAIRFNQNRVVSTTPGSLQGQTVLTLRAVSGASGTATLQFFLFLVPQQS